MTKQKQELTKEKSKYQLTDKKHIIKGSVIATIIASTPLMFQFYKSVPDTKVWDTFLFTYTSIHYDDANVAIWVLSGKLIPLLLLIIWFSTCRHWWHHAIIVPIILYIYQTINSINDDLIFFDDLNSLHLLPVMAIIIPSIYLGRARIFNKLNTVDKTTQDFEDELTFKPKTLWGKIKQFF
ncbi:hypothetical protein [uncultured Lacinutrix sp.]|uniref:hypothetical protein n=1 Tax=uncultured Lacinutrix sp. TaxID=574032 RepID=UPI00260F58A7|nr:hypothetical protein [uncultured Lacinutrix sp.]